MKHTDSNKNIGLEKNEPKGQSKGGLLKKIGGSFRLILSRAEFKKIKNTTDKTIKTTSSELSVPEIIEKPQIQVNEEYYGRRKEALEQKPQIQVNEKYYGQCKEALEQLNFSFGVDVQAFELRMDRALTRFNNFTKREGVLLMAGWNRVLAFDSMFKEALVSRWRMIVAMQSFALKDLSASELQSLSEHYAYRFTKPAEFLVENKKDPISSCLGAAIVNLEDLLFCVIDMAIRELCPHTQIVQRESYSPLKGSRDPSPGLSRIFFNENECTDLDSFCSRFCRFGFEPWYWVSFCEAFIWAMNSHNPYIQPQETRDLEGDPSESVFARFAAGMIATPMIEESLRAWNRLLCQDIRALQLSLFDERNKLTTELGPQTFGRLFQKYPPLRKYFSDKKSKELGSNLIELLGMVFKRPHDLYYIKSDLHTAMNNFAASWRKTLAPADAFALLGNELMDVCMPLLEELAGPNCETAFAYLYQSSLEYVMRPLLVDRKLQMDAEEFIKNVGEELKWSPEQLQNRLFEVKISISTTGSYRHTTEELQTGAQLAWRNSSKCVGRIAWNTLKVRDCRDVLDPKAVFREVTNHIRLASSGANIVSVMTVFRERQTNEHWGMRFWSSQYYRYAGYVDEINGEVLGDPANVSLTSYLMKEGLWKPPEIKTAFDMLPLVLKIPNIDTPFVYSLPTDSIHEITIEHPRYSKVKKLCLKWCSIPAITNFKLNLGGIDYPCVPFNGWFLSTEIVRNLIERYNCALNVAKAIGIDTNDALLVSKVSEELETAVLYSFEKNKYTIVDPIGVGKTFLTHCQREADMGRECPAQWSWIGGLLGPTNPTWHLEMRDFFKCPQYTYCANPWEVTDFQVDDKDLMLRWWCHDNGLSVIDDENNYSDVRQDESIPRVLIAYGSETGTAEAVAQNLARKLKIVKPVIVALNDISGCGLIREKNISHLLVLCSTFGDGAPPTNALNFFATPFESKDILKDVSYATLAFGSSLYPNFCKSGQACDRILYVKGGAKPFMDVTTVDAVKGGDEVVSKWLNDVTNFILPASVVAHIKKMKPQEVGVNKTLSFKIKWGEESKMHSTTLSHMSNESDNEKSFECVENKELFENGHIEFRSTRHIALRLPDGLGYETGDHLRVEPMNSRDAVERLYKCFSYELQRSAEIHGISTVELVKRPLEVVENNGDAVSGVSHLMGSTLDELLMRKLDLSISNMVFWVEFCSMIFSKIENSSLKTISQFDEFTSMRSKTWSWQRAKNNYPTIVDFFEKFGVLLFPLKGSKNALISLADVLVLLPRLQPRYYSISSAAEVSPNVATITVSVYNLQTNSGVSIAGVCSNYLARLGVGSKLNAAVQKSNFRPPVKLSSPVLMICAGTGLAPFLGFLSMRQSKLESNDFEHVGDCKLLFGCRNKKEYLYKNALEEWNQAGIVDCKAAFSREASLHRKSRKRVDDIIKEYGKEISAILTEEDTHVYFCGSASMAKDAVAACIEVLEQHGDFSTIAAKNHIAQKRARNQWQYDVWGESPLDLHVEKQQLTRTMIKEASRVWDNRFMSSSFHHSRDLFAELDLDD